MLKIISSVQKNIENNNKTDRKILQLVICKILSTCIKKLRDPKSFQEYIVLIHKEFKKFINQQLNTEIKLKKIYTKLKDLQTEFKQDKALIEFINLIKLKSLDPQEGYEYIQKILNLISTQGPACLLHKSTFDNKGVILRRLNKSFDEINKNDLEHINNDQNTNWEDFEEYLEGIDLEKNNYVSHFKIMLTKEFVDSRNAQNKSSSSTRKKIFDHFIKVLTAPLNPELKDAFPKRISIIVERLNFNKISDGKYDDEKDTFKTINFCTKALKKRLKLLIDELKKIKNIAWDEEKWGKYIESLEIILKSLKLIEQSETFDYANFNTALANFDIGELNSITNLDKVGDIRKKFEKPIDAINRLNAVNPCPPSIRIVLDNKKWQDVNKYLKKPNPKIEKFVPKLQNGFEYVYKKFESFKIIHWNEDSWTTVLNKINSVKNILKSSEENGISTKIGTDKNTQ